MGDKHTISRFSDKDRRLLETLGTPNIAPLDLLPHRDRREKLVDLVLNGVPDSAARDSATMLGDLRERVTIQSKDELGQLGEGFNKLIMQLSSIVLLIKDYSNKLVDESAEISRSSHQIADGAQQQSASFEEKIWAE